MNIDISKAWRPFEPSNQKRYFIADDFGDYWWVGVATDRDHFIELLRKVRALWEVEVDGQYAPDQGIDVMLEIGLVEVRELGPVEIAIRQSCYTADARGYIPLADAAVGDLFCSEW